MLYMAGGGRISRVHGPFVSDDEVEKVVRHLKTQGAPQYLEEVTADQEEGEDGAVFDSTGMGQSGDANDLYNQAVQVVVRDRKASTSYIQRRLQIGYNRAASLMERMEDEGIVGQPQPRGKTRNPGRRRSRKAVLIRDRPVHQGREIATRGGSFLLSHDRRAVNETLERRRLEACGRRV